MSVDSRTRRVWFTSWIAFRYRPPQWDGPALAAMTEYGASGIVNNTTEQTTVGRVAMRRLQCKWLYVSATDRANRDLYVFGSRMEMLNLDLGTAGLALEQADTFELLYSKYELGTESGTPFMVRSIEPNYMTMTAAVTAWNIDRLSPRRYQADASAAWAAATTHSKSVMGFYGAFSGDDDQIYM